MTNQICKNCTQSFQITDEDLKFYERISPVINGRKFQIPIPTFCPDCRQQRRLIFRNERSLYTRKCDLCGKHTISVYNPSVNIKVFCPDCWWSDKWNGFDYGRSYDFNLSFFKQFAELYKQVPHMSLISKNNENADYVNMSGYNKNCYLIFAAEYNEDCLYGTQVIKSKNCIDTLNCFESENCYEVTDVSKCYELMFSRNCRSCHSSMFLTDCRSCGDCLFCSNLRNKNYCVNNKQLSREEYETLKANIITDLASGKLNELINEFLILDKKSIHKALEARNNENSIGSFLYDSKNCQDCFDLNYGEDCKYVYTGFHVKDLMDVCHTTDGELGYEVTSLGYNSYNILFSCGSWTCNNSMYIENVSNSSDVFGCIGLKHAEYCILNKKYSKEEYEKLLPQILEHMGKIKEYGEFFPSSISPYNYNESLAFDFFPMTREEALAKGYKWREKEAREYLPPTKEILACSDCSKNYRIIAQELDFYRKSHLPLPLKCPDCRHTFRFNLRPRRKIITRNCSKCGIETPTTYSPDKAERIYCEKCYLQEIL